MSHKMWHCLPEAATETDLIPTVTAGNYALGFSLSIRVTVASNVSIKRYDETGTLAFTQEITLDVNDVYADSLRRVVPAGGKITVTSDQAGVQCVIDGISSTP